MVIENNTKTVLILLEVLAFKVFTVLLGENRDVAGSITKNEQYKGTIKDGLVISNQLKSVENTYLKS